MKKYFRKLQSKITICILTFVIIPVIAINLLLQLQLENQLLKNTDFAFQNAVTNVNNTLKTLMREMGVTLNLLSTTPSLYKALETEKKSLNDELKTKITFSTQSEIVVPFWTKDFPELICTGIFSKNSLGEVVYELDFSESTL